jgi:hypothetical protein
LKKRLDEAKKELDIKNERIEIMEASLETMAKVSLDLLDCIQPTRVYSLFLKEHWHNNRISSLSQQVRFHIETPKDFLHTYKSCSMEEKEIMCEFYFHSMVIPHPYNWNPNPCIGEVQIMDFASWLRHE